MSNITRTTELNYGIYKTIVALDDNGNVYIAMPILEKLLGFPADSGRKKIASKSFKSFVGNDYKVGKKSAMISGIGQGKVIFVPLSVFLDLLKWQVKQGNEKAIDLIIAGFGDSFRDFVYHEFGLQLCHEDRQRWLKQRMAHKKQFHSKLTHWFKADGCEDGIEYAKRINSFKTTINLPLITIDQYNEEQLDIINTAEVSYHAFRTAGLTHTQALIQLGIMYSG